MKNYEGQLYGKVNGKYKELAVGTEYVDKIKNENESLTTQLAKANSDKERLGELLKEAIVEYSVQQKHASYEIIRKQYSQAQERILQTLQDCGITL